MYPVEGLVILDSAYAAQLRAGFAGLRFTPPLEAEFRAEYEQQNLPRMRIGFLLASGLYLVFLLVRALAESGPAALPGFLLRLTIIAAMLLTVVVSYTALRRHQRGFVLAAYVVFGSGVTAIELIGHHHGVDRHYEGLIFITIHAYVFSGLVFRQAFTAALLVFLAYVVGGWLGGLAGRAWGYELFFMALLNSLGAVALYQLERVERDNFLRRHLLREMASHDGLTGVHNRNYFLEHFERALRQAARDRQPVAVLMFDVDYFKRFNDRYGHLAGDRALIAVAQALRAQFRRPLDLFARYGGEEFVGLLYEIDPRTLAERVEGMRAAVERLDLVHEDSPFGRVTTCIGAIMLVPAAHESTLELIRLADDDLYSAKHQGRNRCALRRLERETAVTPALHAVAAAGP